MRKKILSILLAGVMMFGLVGCGGNSDSGDASKEVNKSSDETKTSTPAELSGTISITGSTSVEKILNEMIDEFCAIHPDVTINYTGSGSSAGIKDTIEKTNNIGASSRELKGEEQADGLKTEAFAYDGIAVVVNPKCGVSDISLEQLQGIYSGKITNWKELGGEDKEIFVVSREEASGTRSAFEELIKLEETDGLTSNAAVSQGNGPVQLAVAGNECAIGYVSFSYIDDTVKALTVEGIEPTVENVKSKTYALSRPFLFVYLEGEIGDIEKEFLKFALSEDGQKCVETHNGIRID